MSEEPDAVEVMRRRLRYRAGHRGTKELDILLGRFAEAHIESMSVSDLERFERYLAHPDPDINRWIFAPDKHGDSEEFELSRQIRTFHGLE